MTARRVLLVRTLAALWAAVAVAAASQPAMAQAGDAPAPAASPPGPDAGAVPPEARADVRRDPCRPEEHGQPGGLDRFRRGLEQQVCATAQWFDGLFGDARETADLYGKSFGRVGLALNWDELEDVGVDGRFRASLALPQMNRRLNAVVGRDDPESFVDDSYDDVTFLPGAFSDDTSATWYAGVSYLARGDRDSVVDYGAGLKLSTPMNPYVKARYRHYTPLGGDVLLTRRATAFWENDDGFGLTASVEADWSIDDERLLRFANTATFSEATRGLRWRSRMTLYQALGADSAMRYEMSIQGETDGEQPDYKGLRVTHRRSAWRDWFFLEFGTSLFWADAELPEDRCDACLGASFGFEVLFGDRYVKPATVGADEE